MAIPKSISKLGNILQQIDTKLYLVYLVIEQQAYKIIFKEHKLLFLNQFWSVSTFQEEQNLF